MSGMFGKAYKNFDVAYSLVDKILTILAIATGTSVVVWLSKAKIFLNALGGFAYILIFFTVITTFFVIRFIHVRTLSCKAETEYLRKINIDSDSVNPLSDHFENKMIRLEELRLPANQVHTRKTFRNCQLVGPMTVLVLGGALSHSEFYSCGEVIVLPEGRDKYYLNGVLKFKECTFIGCTFVAITIIINKRTSEDMSADMPNIEFIRT
ncbi:hypothetical protein [Pantoea agglomerans]|uniref:hypothetical protein n=1 Tax=Enterobacter agglomerans TaxID=549 RepID=UPI003C7AC4EE